MMEPMRSELPPDGYLEAVKEMAHEHDVILIFDEVSCGWRMAIGGVQEYLGVTPDMTVLAKCISNGYPMGAVVGNRTVMEPASRMFISSSYWSDGVGLVAALTTIRELKRRNAQQRFQEIGEALKEQVTAAMQAAGVEGSCRGVYANPYIEMKLPGPFNNPIDQRKASTIFIQEMAKRGIHCGTSFKATLAHTDEDIVQTGAAAREAFAMIRHGIEQGSFDDLLEADLKKDPFRRVVR